MTGKSEDRGRGVVSETDKPEGFRWGVALPTLAASTFVLAVFGAGTARAFPGFYVGKSGAEPPPRSDRSSLVLMRDGEQTVLSIQSDYVGPRADFVWVLPVPGAIEPEHIHRLGADAFERIERLSSARLVEYWEQNPCAPPLDEKHKNDIRTGTPPATAEARLDAGGYDVSILDGGDAAALGTWLSANGFPIPQKLEAVMRAFARPGYSLVVARVGASRLSFEGRRAVLAPLRLSYRSDRFVLPVGPSRIGADGQENVVIHVLARGQRWIVEDRKNVLVPTNLAMYRSARTRFDAVYAEILQRVWERHPGAVITEYAWQATSCEACPSPAFGASDLDTFGLDVIGRPAGESDDRFVLTKLRTRIDAADTADLVLREAPPLTGGRGRPRGLFNLGNRIDRRAAVNAFQARYAILHKWKGATECSSPAPERWGSPPGRRRPAAIAARPGLETIVKGRLRRFVRTWAPVLRIPASGDAKSAYKP